MENRAIIIEYLLHYCHKDSAKALLKEMRMLDSCSDSIQNKDIQRTTNDSFKEDKIDWKQVEARKVYEFIKKGDIQQAFILINRHFPSLTSSTSNKETDFIIYKLYCQQFIEILRTSGALEAIEFARCHLRPYREVYSEYTNSILCLIAYTDLEHERIKHIMSQEHRDDIADQVNQLLLEAQGLPQQTTLEKLWRQSKVVENELKNRQQGLLKKKDNSKDCQYK